MSSIYTPKPVGKSAKTGKRITYVMSDLQKLAQKENFALFTLVGMRSQLYHLKEVCSSDAISTIKIELLLMETSIREKQQARKQLRNSKKASKTK